MENHPQINKNTLKNVQSANCAVQPTLQVPFADLTNLKLTPFSFSDEGKARSRKYLKKLVM